MSLLDKRFETPYNTAPFSKIKTEDFLPAFVRAIKNAKIEIFVLKCVILFNCLIVKMCNLKWYKWICRDHQHSICNGSYSLYMMCLVYSSSQR